MGYLVFWFPLSFAWLGDLILKIQNNATRDKGDGSTKDKLW